MTRIFISIPILNEAANIEILLRGVCRALDGTDYMVLIIDDGSTDGTTELVEAAITRCEGRIRLMRRRKERRGCQRGAALLAGLTWGLAHTDKDVFIEMDGDLSHRSEEIVDGVRVLLKNAADIVIASKYLPGSSVVNRPLGRRLVSSVCNFATRLVIDSRVSDYSNGYRFYTRRAAEIVLRHQVRYGSPIYLTEVLGIWMLNKLRVREFPSTYIGRNEGLSKLKWFDLFKACFGILDVGVRYHFTGFAVSKTAVPIEPVAAEPGPERL